MSDIRLGGVRDTNQRCVAATARAGREVLRSDPWELLSIGVPEAPCRVASPDVGQRWPRCPAEIHGKTTPRRVDAAGHDLVGPPQVPRDGVERLRVLALAPPRDTAEKADRVGVTGMVEDLFDGS